MKFVPAKFVLYEKGDQNKRGEAKGQPKYIDEGKRLVSEEIPGCYFKYVSEHSDLV
jgi:hypothetical protein